MLDFRSEWPPRRGLGKGTVRFARAKKKQIGKNNGSQMRGGVPEIVVEIIVNLFGSPNGRVIGAKSEHSCFERVQISFKFHFSFHSNFHFSFHLNKTARQVCLKTHFSLP